MTIQRLILDLLARRGPGKSICPSEVARALAPERWRERMEDVRGVARELARGGRIHVTQGERTLDPEGEWRGPVRLRLGGGEAKALDRFRENDTQERPTRSDRAPEHPRPTLRCDRVHHTDYFTIRGNAAPLILTAVHDGHAVRPELDGRFALTPKERLYEEDPHTATWATLREPNVVGLRSRFEVDLNRARDKAVYLEPADAWGLNVWQDPPTPAEIDRSLAAYDAFYGSVKTFLQTVVDEYGSFVVYDIHSYNHRREEDGRQPADPAGNPVVNVGTRNMNRELWAPVVETFIATMGGRTLGGQPLDVRENVKFPGGYFNHWIHETFPDVSCVLSIEFKKVFMDEHSNELHDGPFRELQAALTKTFDPVLQARREVLSAQSA